MLDLTKLKLPEENDQFGTIEQYRELKKLGCPQGVSQYVFVYSINRNTFKKFNRHSHVLKSISKSVGPYIIFDAYSVAELGEMIRQIVMDNMEEFDDDDYKLPYIDYMKLPSAESLLMDEPDDFNWESFWAVYLGQEMYSYDGGSEAGDNSPVFENEAQARCEHLIHLIKRLSE